MIGARAPRPKGRFWDQWTCPHCGALQAVYRFASSFGKRVETYCDRCGRRSRVLAQTITGTWRKNRCRRSA